MKFIKHFVQKRLKDQSLFSPQMYTTPVITITGQNHILIEQHYKITYFSNTEIKLSTKIGTIQIIGTALMIKMMYPQEILLGGTIKKINFEQIV